MKTTPKDQLSAFHPVHPRTGQLIEPLFRWQGKHVYPVFGAAPDDETPANSEPEGEEEGNDGGSEGSSEATVSQAEFNKLKAQLQAADKNRSAAEKRLKELDDAKKDELTKVTERAEELEKTLKARDTELSEMRLQNAFLTADTGVTWHDPGDALALAERKGFLAEVVGEDGTVDSNKLASKLKEMAKSHSYLVKSDGAEEGKPTAPVRTGAPVGGKTKEKKGSGPDLSRYDKLLNR